MVLSISCVISFIWTFFAHKDLCRDAVQAKNDPLLKRRPDGHECAAPVELRWCVLHSPVFAAPRKVDSEFSPRADVSGKSRELLDR